MIEFVLSKYHGISKSHHEYRQLSLVFISIITCTVAAAFFAFYNLVIDYYPSLFYVDFVGTLIGLFTLFIFLRFRYVMLASFILVLMVTGICLMVILDLKNEANSLAWALIAPVLSVFLLGFLYGSLYSFLYLIVIAWFAGSNLGTWQPAEWDFDSYITLIAIYILLFILSCYYEASRRAAQKLLEESNKKLTILATTDPLTGLFNRRFMEDLLLNSKADMFIAMVDVDDFKSINDKFGHTAGDEVLVNISRIMQSTFDTDGIVGRWGGEEFLIAMHDLSAEQFRTQMSELLKNISSHSFGVDRPVTVSLGGVRHNAKEHRMALRSVDEALYDAKMSGKNCIKLADLA